MNQKISSSPLSSITTEWNKIVIEAMFNARIHWLKNIKLLHSSFCLKISKVFHSIIGYRVSNKFIQVYSIFQTCHYFKRTFLNSESVGSNDCNTYKSALHVSNVVQNDLQPRKPLIHQLLQLLTESREGSGLNRTTWEAKMLSLKMMKYHKDFSSIIVYRRKGLYIN